MPEATLWSLRTSLQIKVLDLQNKGLNVQSFNPNFKASQSKHWSFSVFSSTNWPSVGELITDILTKPTCRRSVVCVRTAEDKSAILWRRLKSGQGSVATSRLVRAAEQKQILLQRRTTVKWGRRCSVTDRWKTSSLFASFVSVLCVKNGAGKQSSPPGNGWRHW